MKYLDMDKSSAQVSSNPLIILCIKEEDRSPSHKRAQDAQNKTQTWLKAPPKPLSPAPRSSPLPLQ